MRVIQGNNFAELYKNICHNLMDNPEYETAPRDQKIKEISNAILINHDPTSNLFKNKERNVPLRYLAGELLWYFSGRNDLEFISQFSSFWKNIANPDGTCNSAYGYLLFVLKDAKNKKTQYEWALQSLIKDKDSRQAIIHFNRPIHQYETNKDFVCTLNGVFQIRDNKLNFTIDMRSNDIYFGLTFDYPFFTLLQQQMFLHLKKYYPELQLGTYTHVAHSLHIYEKDFDKIYNMMQHEFLPDNTPILTHNLINENGNMVDDIQKIISGDENYNNNVNIYKWLYNNTRS